MCVSVESIVRKGETSCNKQFLGRKHCEKRRNCLLQAIAPFLTIFSTQYGTYFSF